MLYRKTTFFCNITTMLKSIGVFLLSVFMFSQMYNTYVWVNYELNIDEITNAFCINADKPELNCHGTCHLKKQLISRDTSIPIDEQNALYTPEIELFHSEASVLTIDFKSISLMHLSPVMNHYSFLFGLNLWQPPEA